MFPFHTRRARDHRQLFLLIVMTAGTAWVSDSNYLTDLIRRAREGRISEQRYWHLLLYYREDPGG